MGADFIEPDLWWQRWFSSVYDMNPCCLYYVSDSELQKKQQNLDGKVLDTDWSDFTL
jgi:hypothetical protein